MHEELGILTENIFTLSDKEHEDENGHAKTPGLSEIFGLLGELQGEIKEDDLLLFFFLGHGMRDPKDKQDYLLVLSN